MMPREMAMRPFRLAGTPRAATTDIPAFYADWFMERLKDPGQRLACGCIMSKDVGEYNTCPHLCHYCYANTNNAAAMENWKRHCKSLHADTIAG